MNVGIEAGHGDLHYMTVSDAAHAIAAKELSPVELMQAHLARIEKLNPTLNAFIRLDGEAALAAAKVAEAEATAGRLRGPLHGIPVGIKDIIDVAGLPTTCHSKILDGNMATADAVCVARLRAAGWSRSTMPMHSSRRRTEGNRDDGQIDDGQGDGGNAGAPRRPRQGAGGIP